MNFLTYLSDFPSISPIYACVAFLLLPIIPLVIFVWICKHKSSNLHGVYIYLYRYSSYVAFGNLFLALILTVNQGSFLVRHYENGFDLNQNVDYYMKTNTVTSYGVETLDAATISNSLAIKMFTTSTGDTLTTSNESDDILRIIYHYSKGNKHQFSNVLTRTNLLSVCNTEKNILAGLTCLDTSYYRSIMPDLFDMDTCSLKASYSSTIASIDRYQNEIYLSDSSYLTAQSTTENIQSEVLISYFKIGSCHTMTNNDFQTELSKYNVGNIDMLFSSSHFNKNAMNAMQYRVMKYGLGSLALGSLYFISTVRGFICAVITIIGLVAASLAAITLLPYFGYSSISFLNVIGFLISAVLGMSSIQLFGSSWRGSLKIGTTPTVTSMHFAFTTYNSTIFATYFIAIVSSFSCSFSSSVIISQLGIFTGFSLFFFYFMMYYVIVPMWIFNSWFVLPSSWHTFCIRNSYACCSAIQCNKNVGLDDENFEFEDDIEGSQPYRSKSPDNNRMDLDFESKSDHSDFNHSVKRANRTSQLIAISQESDHLSDHFESVHFQSSASKTQLELQNKNEQNLVRSNINNNNKSNKLNSKINNKNIIQSAENDLSFSTIYASEEDVLNNDDKNLADDMCGGKRPLKCLAFIVLFTLTAGLVALMYFTALKFEMDYRIPNFYDHNSNIGLLQTINSNYRHDIFLKSQGIINYAAIPPTSQPTAYPTAIPTIRPTVAPSGPSVTPTSIPSSSHRKLKELENNPALINLNPSLRGIRSHRLDSHIRSLATDDTVNVVDYTDYSINYCYGLSYEKTNNPNTESFFYQSDFSTYQDDKLTVIYENVDTFKSYLNDGGFEQDSLTLCNYIETNRVELNVHPDWNKESDCLYYQYNTTKLNYGDYLSDNLNHTVTTSEVLLYMSSLDHMKSNLMGVSKSNNNNNNNSTIGLDLLRNYDPLWICSNISMRTYLSSLMNTKLSRVESINKLWINALNVNNKQSSYTNNDESNIIISDETSNNQNALKYSINILFSSPQLSNAYSCLTVTKQMIYSIYITIAAFLLMLLYKTDFEIGLVLSRYYSQYNIYFNIRYMYERILNDIHHIDEKSRMDKSWSPALRATNRFL
eukprot:gene12680-17002_t